MRVFAPKNQFDKMGSMTVVGANPIVHLSNREIGNNVLHFRQNLFRERLANAKNLYRKDLIAHYGCVNAIEFSSVGDLLISGIASYFPSFSVHYTSHIT